MVEAPGAKKTVRSISASLVQVGSGAKKQKVDTYQSRRDSAANWAYGKRGKAYNYVFYDNKYIESTVYNCSQLVWAAYRKYGNDLDSNGGLGVYPSNIRDSGLTITYKTF